MRRREGVAAPMASMAPGPVTTASHVPQLSQILSRLQLELGKHSDPCPGVFPVIYSHHALERLPGPFPALGECEQQIQPWETAGLR